MKKFTWQNIITILALLLNLTIGIFIGKTEARLEHLENTQKRIEEKIDIHMLQMNKSSIYGTTGIKPLALFSTVAKKPTQ